MKSKNIARPRPATDETLGFGLWEKVQRHPVSVLVVVSLSLLVGGALYLNLPPTYEASADVLVETVQMTGLISSSGIEEVTTSKNLETHALILCSPLILQEAVKRDQLSQLPSLVDEENPVDAIRRHLVVQPKQESKTVLTIIYTGHNSDDCKKIVTSLIETYNQFLKDVNRQVKAETVEMISHARADLAEQLGKREESYERFQSQSRLMRRDGQGINHHHERQLEIEHSRTEAFVEEARLNAKLKTALEAVRAGGLKKEAIYFEALAALSVSESGNTLFDRSLSDAVLAQRRYRTALIAKLRNLQVREEELLVEYAEGHPDVMAVRHQIQDLESEIHGVKPHTTGADESMESVDLVDAEAFRSGKDLSDPVEELHELLMQDAPWETTSSDMTVSESDQSPEIDPVAHFMMPQAGGIELDSMEQDEATDFVAIYIQGLQRRLGEIHRELKELDASYQQERQAANDLQEFLVRDESLRADVGRTRQLLDVVALQCDEVNVVESRDGDALRVLAAPQFGEQVSPDLAMLLLGFGFGGVLGGVGMAWYIDHHEAMLRSPEEIRRMMKAPVVGQIPVMKWDDKTEEPRQERHSPMLCTASRSDSIMAEAFRSIRTTLYFHAKDERGNVIQITSAMPEEGKTTLTANLAVAIAQSGKRVAVLDTDFRRPRLHTLFFPKGLSDASPTAGVAGVINGNSSFVAACVDTGIANLTFCPAGERPDNPSELLTSQGFEKLLDQLRARYDWVLLDTPPLLAVTDSSIIAARADGVLFNLRMRKGMRHAAIQSQEMLAKVGAKLVGVVVNAVDDLGAFATIGYGSGETYFSHSVQNGEESVPSPSQELVNSGTCRDETTR